MVRDAGEVGWPYLGYGVEFLFVPPESQLAIEMMVASSVVSLTQITREGALAGHPRHRALGGLDLRDRGARWPTRRGGWWRSGGARARAGGRAWPGPYYVVEGPSPEAALRAAREFVHAQE